MYLLLQKYALLLFFIKKKKKKNCQPDQFLFFNLGCYILRCQPVEQTKDFNVPISDSHEAPGGRRHIIQFSPPDWCATADW